MSSRKLGRPSVHRQATADKVCRLLASGMTLRAVCRQDEMPEESTVRSWVMDDRNGFAAQYARAREIGYQAMADEIVEIADDGRNDTAVDGDGNERTDHDVVQRSKLRVDTRKWLLSKALPKVYGDKLTAEHVGAGGGPIEHQTVVILPANGRESNPTSRG